MVRIVRRAAWVCVCFCHAKIRARHFSAHTHTHTQSGRHISPRLWQDLCATYHHIHIRDAALAHLNNVLQFLDGSPAVTDASLLHNQSTHPLPLFDPYTAHMSRRKCENWCVCVRRVYRVYGCVSVCDKSRVRPGDARTSLQHHWRSCIGNECRNKYKKPTENPPDLETHETYTHTHKRHTHKRKKMKQTDASTYKKSPRRSLASAYEIAWKYATIRHTDAANINVYKIYITIYASPMSRCGHRIRFVQIYTMHVFYARLAEYWNKKCLHLHTNTDTLWFVPRGFFAKHWSYHLHVFDNKRSKIKGVCFNIRNVIKYILLKLSLIKYTIKTLRIEVHMTIF